MSEINDWVKLDNAGKIYPAARRRNWMMMFRLSATLKEEIDPEVLVLAQERVLKRLPYFAYRLRHGMFWYYMERTDSAPPVEWDVNNPCVPMQGRGNGFCFRVRWYERRIAVEFYHVLTDGAGGMVFLKTLVAEYLRLKYGADIPRDDTILDCDAPPRKEEMEDSFLAHAGEFTLSRSEVDSYQLRGEKDRLRLVNVITGIMPGEEIRARAKALGVTVTEYLTAVMLLSVDAIQRRHVRERRHMMLVKISVPVNLRALFPSKTVRNFSSYVNPGFDPRLGEYTMEEVAQLVHHFMRSEVTAKTLNAKFTTNVKSEQNGLLRAVPLFLKNPVMRMVFNAVGDRKYALSFSNLGNVVLPQKMACFIERIEFLLGPMPKNKVGCACAGYEGKLFINFTRTMIPAELEREFFTRLVKLGVPVKIESNRRDTDGLLR